MKAYLVILSVLLLVGIGSFIIVQKNFIQQSPDRRTADSSAVVDSLVHEVDTTALPCNNVSDNKHSTYDDLARATGGQAQHLEPSEVDKSGQLINTFLNKETIASIYDCLTGAEKQYTFPVDSFADGLSVSVFAAKDTDNKRTINSILISPAGEPVNAETMTRLSTGQVYTITKPQVGTWRLKVQGKGMVSAQAVTGGYLFLVEAQFVERGGRPGHEGYFPITGLPSQGKKYKMHIVTSDDNIKTLQVALLSETGLETLGVFSGFTDTEQGSYYGDVIVPTKPFRISIMGKDSNNQNYKRTLGPLITPQ